MDAFAMLVGFIVLAWMFVGPLVGYAVAVRGWRFRSPLTRDGDGEEA